MTTYIGAAILVLGFFAFIKLFKIIDNSYKAINLSKAASSIIGNPDMDDLEKEKALQSHSIQLFKLFFILFVGLSLALAIPLGLLWCLEQFDILSINAVLAFTLSWEFILGSSLLICSLLYLFRKR